MTATYYFLQLLCIPASFFTALLSRWRWTVIVFPVLALVLGKLDSDQAIESQTQSFGPALIIPLAVLTAFAWLFGRWLRGRMQDVP